MATTLTSALEDYLEAILELGERERKIRVTDLADRLNIAKPTVSQTINKLKKMGLVIQESYGPIELTRVGQEYASAVRKRHRSLRRFLIEILGVDYPTAEKDACLMEHVLSPVTMEKIAEFIVKAHEAEKSSTAENTTEINTAEISITEINTTEAVLGPDND